MELNMLHQWRHDMVSTCNRQVKNAVADPGIEPGISRSPCGRSNQLS